MPSIPAQTLVVVADGTGARLFRNVGSAARLSLSQIDMTEAVGLDDDGPSGSTPPDSTPQQLDEATFAKQLVHRLNHGALTGRYENLVLIADPQTLGQMRPQLHKETLSRLVTEIGKTLTNSPVEDIERALD